MASRAAAPAGGSPKNYSFPKVEGPKGPIYCKIQRETTYQSGRETAKTTQSSVEYWIKGKNIRIEDHLKNQTRTVIIVHEQTAAYAFTKGEKQAKRLDALKLIMASVRVRDLMPQEGKRKKIGDETVSGKACEVFTVELVQSPSRRAMEGSLTGGRPQPVKEWVWKEKNVVLKREVSRETEKFSFKDRLVITEISADPSLPDSLFSIQGLRITDAPGGLFGLGGIPHSPGKPSGPRPR